MIPVELPPEHWEAVLRAMRWALPPADAPEDSEGVLHSDRCFEAQVAIRVALGPPEPPRRPRPDRMQHNRLFRKPRLRVA